MRVRGYVLVDGWPDPFMCELAIVKRGDRDGWELAVYGDKWLAWHAWKSIGREYRPVEIFVDGLPDIRGLAVVSSVNAPPSLGLTGEVEVRLFGIGALYDEDREEVTADTLKALAYVAQRMSP